MRKKIGLLLIMVLTLLCVPVHAKTEENFRAGEDVVIDKSIGATTFIAGNLVDVRSEIDGISFVAGNTISMSNKQDYAFVAGNNINLNTFSAKDAFIAGNTITIKETTVRDLYVSGSTIKVEGVVTNNAYLAGENVIINANINGDVYVASENISVGENAIINGTLKYPENVRPNISKHAQIAKTKTYKETTVNIEGPSIQSVLFGTIISYVSSLIVAFVFMTLYKKLFEKFLKYTKKNNDLLKTAGIGLLGLVAIPAISILVMITIVGLPLGLLAIVIYGILVALSTIPTAYWLGNVAFKDKIKDKYLLLALSLLIIYLLEQIPVIGGIVGFITLCIGLGIYMRLIKETIKLK